MERRASELIRCSILADQPTDSEANFYLVSGANLSNVTGSFAVTTNPVFVTHSGNFIAISGTVNTSVVVGYIVSGNSFIPSGNVYIQSGVNWTGVGSTFSAGGSLNINNPQLIGSIATQGIIGSVAITSNPVNVTPSGVFSTSIDRASQKQGRTHIQKSQVNITTAGSVNAYTVTNGKTFYMTYLDISGYNNSAVTAGQWTLQDGSGGTTLMAGNLPAVVATLVAISQDFSVEPIQWTNSIWFNPIAGNPTLGISFGGYEE